MRKVLKINGNRTFRKKVIGSVLPQKLVKLSNCYDVFPDHSVKTMFPNAQNLFLEKCDLNFQYYWLKKNIWPNLKNIYMDTKLERDCRLFEPFNQTQIFVPKHTFSNYSLYKLYNDYPDRRFEGKIHFVSNQFILKKWKELSNEICEK